MAMTYQNFASLGVNLNRQKYGPLDISAVFNSEADLKYYLSKGAFTEGVSEYWYKNENEKIVPYPYEGQIISTVFGEEVKTYVLALDATGNFKLKSISQDLSLLLHFTASADDPNTGILKMHLAQNDESIVQFYQPAGPDEPGVLSFYSEI